MDTNEDAKPVVRRRHSRELKSQVLAQCAAPGASVAKVAMAHGVNANLVHKWRRQSEALGNSEVAAFVPVAVAPPSMASEAPQFVDLELQRGPINVRVRWPMPAAPSCAAWFREILR
ncbi:IS66-like element accessory protein TnpA [Piscinibacter koreensis]|uniref:Transposase n=1 Tax=Piscinibacter koreensis TaxID=2742824 RepID=A0A7Y6NRS4_9BURK|nr:transposase [Schlegelella koreensis]